ncbi:hypothetical protein G7046_g8028 [Stylonectria norvegica]|nr:hypothetical protein G7046_g8028 [Stylonectria norvegica]
MDAERRQIITQLEQKLSDWYKRIPATFSMEHVSSTVKPCWLVQMTKLYFGYLLTEVMTHGLYSGDADWVTHLGQRTRVTTKHIMSIQYDFGATRSHYDQSPPSSSGWDKLVEVSRECLKLFHTVADVESLIWQCSCGHASALIILLANICLHPALPYISFDQYLTTKSVKLYNGILEVTPDKALVSLRELVTELFRNSTRALETCEVTEDSDAIVSFYDDTADWNMFLPVEDFGFSTFEDNPDYMAEFLEANPS